MVRIFTACHGTQLLVIQHLRHHLQLPPAREFLLWFPCDNIPQTDAFIQECVATAGFDGVLDMRAFKSLQPRTQGPVAWWFEAARRCRTDARTVRSWMSKNDIVETDVELWADEPIHFGVSFLKALLRKARHAKFPHCFNHEDAGTTGYRARLVEGRHSAHWLKRLLFWPWLQWASGCDWSERSLHYDVGFSFDLPSPWAEESVDVSHLINIEAFRATYRTLPASLRSEVESILAPISAGPKPLVLLLLFGLDSQLQQVYRRSLSRVFAERVQELRGCSLAIKVHPGARGIEEELFFDWARSSIPARVFPIRSALNLEFMLPKLCPAYVLAGPCGALPIVKRLRVAQPIVLPEILEAILLAFPDDQPNHLRLVRGMETW